MTKERMTTTEKRMARQLVDNTKGDRRDIKRLRKLGASNREIARALGIPENSLLLS